MSVGKVSRRMFNKIASEGLDAATKPVAKAVASTADDVAKVVASSVDDVASASVKTVQQAAASTTDDMAKWQAKAVEKAARRETVERGIQRKAEATRNDVVNNITKSGKLAQAEASTAFDEALSGMTSRSGDRVTAGSMEKITRNKIVDNRISQIRANNPTVNPNVIDEVTETSASNIDDLLSSKPNSIDKYTAKRYHSTDRRLNKGETSDMGAVTSGDTNAINKMSKKFNVDPNDTDGLIEKISSHYDTLRANNPMTTTTRDKVGYYQVPQKAAAVGGTAWLVSRLSNNGGRQSNAELYGQQRQY